MQNSWHGSLPHILPPSGPECGQCVCASARPPCAAFACQIRQLRVLVIGVGSFGSTMPPSVTTLSNWGHIVLQTADDRYSVSSSVGELVQLVSITLQ